AFVRPAAAPVIAVGNRLITLTPQPVKSTAIDSAGTDDKPLLLIGIYVLLAVFGAMIGSAALVGLRRGLIGVAVLTAFGSYCALTANASRVSDVVPTLGGGVVSAGALVLLVRFARFGETAQGTGSPGRPHADRRVFLQGAGAAVVVAAATGFVGREIQHARFDVADARAKIVLPPARADGVAQTVPLGADLGKSPVPWRTPNGNFYRIDTALTVPQISPKDWRLRIHGMVDRPITISYDDLLKRPLVDRWITLCCVSNPVGGELVSNSLWRGALLADLLREAGLRAESDQLVLTSEDGMTLGAPTAVVMDGRAALLAVGMNGQPLPLEHGFPARVVVPGLYGYVSACKWVVDIEATTYAANQPYWVQGGWAAKTPVKMLSRIDRPTSSGAVTVGQTTTIAGVAWDQHVGISKVEVRVNDDPWRSARLARVPSSDTWRQWVLPWTPPKSGQYRLTVRATDAAGNLQDTKSRDVFPSGATGLHTVTVRAVG
ncbi:MAG: molybdopterin-dependent oxidoreductase, partial [Jatrophihabitans sp.]